MSSVTFKCKSTGNTVTFRDEADIAGMRKHPEYDEITESVQLFPKEEQVLSEKEQPQPKRMGRPSKKD